MANQYGNYNNQGSSGGGVKQIFFGRNALSRLILINLAVFVVLSIVRLVMYLLNGELQDKITNPISDIALWLAVPASLHELLNKPWTILTYMFLHESLLHIFFNMLMLYFSGRIFIEYLGGKKLTFVYLFGGFFGAFLYILAFNTLPAFSGIVDRSVALGASASVLAVLVALATFIPDYAVVLLLIGRMKLKYIALIFVVVDILSIERSNPGGHIAHLGGALFGFFYILTLKKGTDISKMFNPIGRFFKNLFKPKPKLRTTYSKRPLTDDEYNERRAERQKKIDVILDKIAKSGYESLTKEEKEMLFKASNNEF
jgi:membrane associated rhomboid family serine protease